MISYPTDSILKRHYTNELIRKHFNDAECFESCQETELEEMIRLHSLHERYFVEIVDLIAIAIIIGTVLVLV